MRVLSRLELKTADVSDITHFEYIDDDTVNCYTLDDPKGYEVRFEELRREKKMMLEMNVLNTMKKNIIVTQNGDQQEFKTDRESRIKLIANIEESKLPGRESVRVSTINNPSSVVRRSGAEISEVLGHISAYHNDIYDECDVISLGINSASTIEEIDAVDTTIYTTRTR